MNHMVERLQAMRVVSVVAGVLTLSGCVSFSPDGQFLLTSSLEVVQFWNFASIPLLKKSELIQTACNRVIENFNETQWNKIQKLIQLGIEQGATLLDVQWCTEHLASLGAVEVPRADYLVLLAEAVGST